MFVCLQKGAKQCCELTKLSYTYCSGEQPSGVSSPAFWKGQQKVIFINVYSGIAVDHAEKSRRFSICPTTFFLNWRPWSNQNNE